MQRTEEESMPKNISENITDTVTFPTETDGFLEHNMAEASSAPFVPFLEAWTKPLKIVVPSYSIGECSPRKKNTILIHEPPNQIFWPSLGARQGEVRNMRVTYRGKVAFESKQPAEELYPPTTSSQLKKP